MAGWWWWMEGCDNAFPDWAAFNEMTGLGAGGVPLRAQWYFQNGKLTSDNAPCRRVMASVNPSALCAPASPSCAVATEWMHATDEL
jgi:hypothetical protein